jgi:hypothetical protein
MTQNEKYILAVLVAGGAYLLYVQNKNKGTALSVAPASTAAPYYPTLSQVTPSASSGAQSATIAQIAPGPPPTVNGSTLKFVQTLSVDQASQIFDNYPGVAKIVDGAGTTYNNR